MCNDVRFVLLNKPFPDAPLDRSLPDAKAKFLLKRFKVSTKFYVMCIIIIHQVHCVSIHS